MFLAANLDLKQETSVLCRGPTMIRHSCCIISPDVRGGRGTFLIVLAVLAFVLDREYVVSIMAYVASI